MHSVACGSSMRPRLLRAHTFRSARLARRAPLHLHFRADNEQSHCLSSSALRTSRRSSKSILRSLRIW
jgi:hypothetical protein